jgi:hypothetical protein
VVFVVCCGVVVTYDDGLLIADTNGMKSIAAGERAFHFERNEKRGIQGQLLLITCAFRKGIKRLKKCGKT